MRVEPIADPGDPRLRDFTGLRDEQLRRRREAEEGMFLAEGEATIRRAAAAGYRMRAVLLTEQWLAPLADLLDPLEVTVLVVEPEVLEATAGFPVHRGALASFERRPLPTVEQVFGAASTVAVLEDISDHTNLGAIFRSAAALGVDAVLLTPRCGDPLYRRAIRTSMGAVFSIPWTRIAWREGPGLLRRAGLEVWALTPAKDAVPIEGMPRPARVAVALGAEGPGLSEHWLGEADRRVRITISPGTDSLNVAAAAAIAFHALTQEPPAG